MKNPRSDRDKAAEKITAIARLIRGDCSPELRSALAAELTLAAVQLNPPLVGALAEELEKPSAVLEKLGPRGRVRVPAETDPRGAVPPGSPEVRSEVVPARGDVHPRRAENELEKKKRISRIPEEDLKIVASFLDRIGKLCLRWELTNEEARELGQILHGHGQAPEGRVSVDVGHAAYAMFIAHSPRI